MDKKKVITTVAVGAATLAAGVANAHADSVTVTKQQVGDATKVTTTTTKTTATQQQINQTKSEISSQQAVVNQDKANVDSAQSKVNQDSADTAQAQSVVNQKKNDLVNAQSAVNNAQKNQSQSVQANQNAQSAAQSKVTADKNAVSSQQTVVNQAKVNQANAQNANDQAQNKVRDAQAKNTSAQQKVTADQNNVNNAQQKVNADQTQVNNQQTVVNNDQQKINDDQNQINQSSAKLQSDHEKLANDQNTLSNDQQTLTNDQNTVNDLQSKLNEVQSQSENSIYIDPSFTEAMFDSSDTNAIENAMKKEQDYYKFDDQNNKFVDDHYISNKADQEVKVDIHNLSNQTINELTQWTASLLNQIRNQIGNPNVKITVGSQNYTKELVDRYNNDLFDPNTTKDHDENAINNLDTKYNVQDPEAMAEIISNYEYPDGTSAGLGGSYTGTPVADLTLDDLKHNIYDSMLTMLFYDKGSKIPYGHTKSLIGYYAHKDKLSAEGFGFGIDNFPQAWDHFEFIDNALNGTLGNSLYDDTEVPNLNSSVSQQQIDEIKSQLEQQQSKVNQDQLKVNADQAQVNADQNQIEQDTPTALENQLQNDQQALQNDQNKLLSDQQTLQNDQQALENAQSTLAHDQAVANQTQSDLSAAQQEANQTQINLDNANTILTNAQQKLNDLNAQLNKDKNELANLHNQVPNIQALETKLAQAQNEYNAAVQALQAAQTRENNDRDALATAQQEYSDALNKLSQLESELRNEEQTTTTTSVQWIKNQHPVTTADMGNVVSLHPSINSSSTTHTDSHVATTVKDQSKNPVVTHSESQTQEVTGSKSSHSTSSIHANDSVKNSSLGSKKSELVFKAPAQQDVTDTNVVYADDLEIASNDDKVDDSSDVIKFTTAAPVSNKNSMPQTGESDNSKVTLWGELSLAAAGILSVLGLADRKRRN